MTVGRDTIAPDRHAWDGPGQPPEGGIDRHTPIEDANLQRGIEVRLASRSGPPLHRHQEPVTVGIPLPRGAAMDADDFSLWDGAGAQVPCDARVLDRWSDESIRWLLVDAQVTSDPAAAGDSYRLRHQPGLRGPGIEARQDGARVHLDTGRLQCVIAPGTAFPFQQLTADGAAAIDVTRCGFEAIADADGPGAVTFDSVSLEDAGAMRTVVAVEGRVHKADGKPALELLVRLHFYAGSATVRWLVRTRNPRKAAHPDGYWDLGAGGSVLLRDFSLNVALAPGGADPVVRCSPETGAAFEQVHGALSVYQDSSGGENWQSTNHINRLRAVPNTFRGYRMTAGTEARSGLRATPIVELQRGRTSIAACLPHFWQNFPRAIDASDSTLSVRFFPRHYADLHEIQGGEQKTHELFVAFAKDSVTADPLAWCRARLVALATPSWYAESGAIAYLTPADRTVSQDHIRLVRTAVEGADSFEGKREVVDEYGWRHFGDIYGDHEGAHHQGPAPLVSHYNNQYDPVGGFGLQFLRSGDVRWWSMMEDLAAHVVDIDIYHTQQDKWAYNHGLFWHTYHYGDADTATHRSYPRAGAKVIGGGGPSPDQNYTSGLMLHYFLTGEVASRDTVIDSAQYVIDVDDGTKTVFRWLDRGYTGLATASGSYSYHGPGRSPANSVNALLDGFRLTGRRRFMNKADEIVLRCIHPKEDIAARDLGHTEMKWFYTMFLQSLGKYLDERAERGHLDAMYSYARGSLLHYARWMLAHEYPYLDKPEKLEFPTETWAAQEMRKSDVFYHAMKHAEGEERRQFAEQAAFYYRYGVTTLAGMPTRTLARPVVIMLSNGWLHAWFVGRGEVRAPQGLKSQDFAPPEPFVPQKFKAKRRAMLLAGAGGGVGVAGVGYLLLRLFGPL